VEIQRGEMEDDRVAEATAAPRPARHPLDPPVGGLIDSAASFGQPITTASRNAVNREPGSTHSVVARAAIAAMRIARLAGVLEEDLDRAGRDDGCRGVTHTKA
jgi:hypothetical protein